MKEEKLIRKTKDEFDFPSNSEKKDSQEQPKEREKLAPIVKGQVVKKKKTFTKRMSELFFGDETVSIMDYIVYDILIPTIKNTISDVVTSSLEMTLFGERRSRGNISRNRDRSYVSYSSYSKSDRDSRDRDERRSNRRNNHDFDDVLFESRPEAEEVLSHLGDLIMDYGFASVADFYDICGLESEYTDNKYGWTSLRDAHTDRVRNGYIIRFPRTRPIE